MISRRITPQRKLILSFLRGVKTHPTAEMVYREVVQTIPNITLATVYRNLNILSKDGDILRLEINNEYHYDADISFHQHCFCEKCKKIFDIFNPKLSQLAIDAIDANKFKVKNVHITFNGICTDCANS